MKIVLVNIMEYNFILQEHICDECGKTFIVLFNWHIKFIECPECGEIYEVGFR